VSYQFPTDAGDFIEAVVPLANAVTLTTGLTAVVASIKLTLPPSGGLADWDCWGVITWHPNAATTMQQLFVAITNTPSSINDTVQPAGKIICDPQGGITSTVDFQTTGPLARFSFNKAGAPSFPAGDPTVYLVVNATFATNVMSAYGYLRARRAVN
jgi:hypothetical protein